MKRHLVIALVGMTGVAACGSRALQPMKDIPAGKRLVAVPPAVAIPIDAALARRATSELESALASQSDVIRAHAVEALKDLKWPNAATILTRALADRSPLVRKAAAFAAGELRLSTLKPQLEADVDNGQLPNQMADIFALHRLGDTRRSHLFERTANDADKYVRGDTALILGMLGEKSATAILVQLMAHDREQLVRLQAAEALWKLGDERGLNELIGATISLYPDDRMIAATALAGPRDTRVLGNVEGLLTDDYPEVALVAAAATGRLGSDDGYGVALRATKNVDPRKRFLAAIALGAIGRSDAQPALATLLDDATPDVRLAAATAILQLHV